MNYHELTVKELKELMRDRQIPGRSSFTIKQDIIDRLIQDDQERELAGFTGKPPARPIAVPTPTPSPKQPSPGKTVPFFRPARPAACVETLSDRPPARPAAQIQVLSIQQPWAWAIFHAGKDVENRTWPTAYRGEFYIHASKKYDRAGAEWIKQKFGIVPPEPSELPLGAIVGRVNLVHCVRGADSPWSMPDQFQFELSKAIAFEQPVPCRGQLKFFAVDASILNASQESVVTKTQSDRPPAKQKIISFARTSKELMSGIKTVSRRFWKEKTLQSWQKAWDEKRYYHRAYDRSLRSGGRQIGEIWLVERPYLEKLADMPQSDVSAEGFPELTKSKFIQRFFKGNEHCMVAVVRFIFVPSKVVVEAKDFDHLANSFQVTPDQIKRKLKLIVENELHRPRQGEFVRFLNSPFNLPNEVDRAIAGYLDAHPYFEYVGKTNKILSDPPLTNFYGWRLHSSRIEYGQSSCSFLWLLKERLITKEDALYRELWSVFQSCLTYDIGDRYFGPILNPAEMSQMDWQKSPWLFGNCDGYWLVREYPDLSQAQVFRWWWTESAGWRLDFNRVMVRPNGKMKCSCQRKTCAHLKAIRRHRQREHLLQQEAIARQKDFERNQNLFQIEKERTELEEWLKNNHFNEAAAIGHKLFRQPFWGLSLDCLKQIRAKLKKEVQS